MTLTLAVGRPTLADRIFSRKLVTDIALVASGAALVSLLAQVTIPLPLVPITGQTLAVLVVGAALGASRGAISLALYAAIGFAGLPVFAPEDDGSHVTGLAALAGNSAGYIVGFILAAALTGWLAQREWDRKFLKALVTFAVGTIATFVVGLPWLAVWLTVNGADNVAYTVFYWGFLVFVPGGIIKAALAAGIIRLAWHGVKRADESAAAADAE